MQQEAGLKSPRSHTDKASVRISGSPLALSLCGLAMVAGAAILLGADGPRRPAAPACQAEEVAAEVRYRDFGPSALIITRPCHDAPQQPYVVLASYISLVDADYYTGKEAARAILTARDSHYFMYGWLARALARQGIASVRYDPIAVRSRQKDGKGFAGAIVVEEDLLRVRRPDFSGLLEMVLSRTDEMLGRSSTAPVILVGHSGGAFTIGDFLEKARSQGGAGRSRPFGFVGIAPAVSDATGIQQTHWRYWVKQASACLTHSQAKPCLDRLAAELLFPRVFADPALRSRVETIFLASPDKATLLEALDRELRDAATRLERMERDNLSGMSVVEGRYRIQQALVHELAFRVPSAAALSCRTQASALVYGGEDLILDPQFETAAWTRACGRASDITVLPGLGHSLGLDAYYGPPSPQALEIVVGAIASVTRSLDKGPFTAPDASTPAPASPSSPPRPNGTLR